MRRLILQVNIGNDAMLSSQALAKSLHQVASRELRMPATWKPWGRAMKSREVFKIKTAIMSENGRLNKGGNMLRFLIFGLLFGCANNAPLKDPHTEQCNKLAAIATEGEASPREVSSQCMSEVAAK